MAIAHSPVVEVIDIRRDKADAWLAPQILNGLADENPANRYLPTIVLYDERGLNLFEEITYLDEYYLTNAEVEVLQTHADAIVKHVPEGCRLLELGSGNLRKVKILLQAFERAKKTVEYYALDLSLSELHRTLSQVSVDHFHYVQLCALHGTYDDGLEWISETAELGKPTCVMSLGSSLGNFSRNEASAFLSGFAALLQPGDSLLVGLDACQDPIQVYRAYNDSQGVTHHFYRNGLDHANNILGFEAFKQHEWNIIGRYDEALGRHEAFYEARKEIAVGNARFQKGDWLKVEDACKYSSEQSDVLWRAAGLIKQTAWSTKTDDYHIHLLAPAKAAFLTSPEEYAAAPVPSANDWHGLWVSWDLATRTMIPSEDLLEKPIKLRNNLIFYLGHIPAFADIHMIRATGGKPTDPAYYHTIFERGIDPDVDNPELCHAHSELPDEFPPLGELLEYQRKVRERILDATGCSTHDRRLGRSLWLAFEHEAMHLETFLYMLLHSQRLLPPPGHPKPDFRSLALEAREKRVANQWHRVPEDVVTLGLDDSGNDHGPDRYFGWDNERPSRQVAVHGFEAQSRPISNGEYAHFLEVGGSKHLPASWIFDGVNGAQQNGEAHRATNGIHHNGTVEEGQSEPTKAFLNGKSVRTVYGPVPLSHVLDWPVMASYDELAAYAAWAGGRIPTLEETRSLYAYVEAAKEKIGNVPAALISAVNGHLSLNGVEETPPHGRCLNGFPKGKQRPDPRDIFISLQGCNVGFSNFHPAPVTQNGGRLCGQSDAGGLWEWTSTSFAEFEGFKPMDLYPGYSADFFDEKHNIILGGSWATHPRIAGRKTFVNWYQRNYPYTWATARLVRDL